MIRVICLLGVMTSIPLFAETRAWHSESEWRRRRIEAPEIRKVERPKDQRMLAPGLYHEIVDGRVTGVAVEARLNMRRAAEESEADVVEHALVEEPNSLHEALLATKVTPTRLQKALGTAGLGPSSHGEIVKLDILVRYSIGDQVYEEPLANWITDRKSGKRLRHPFKYDGGPWEKLPGDKHYTLMTEVSKHMIALKADPHSLVDANPWIVQDDLEALTENAFRPAPHLPPRNSKVTLVFRRKP